MLEIRTFQQLRRRIESLEQGLSESRNSKQRERLLKQMKILLDEIDELIFTGLFKPNPKRGNKNQLRPH